MRGRVVAAVCAAVVGVAGCTSNTSDRPHAASASPSGSIIISHASTAAAPTPSVVTTGPNVRPGEKPPVLDAIGRTKTNAGALTFVRYWIQTLDWGYATTSSTLPRQNYLASCTDCARFMGNYDDASAKGDHFRGGRVSILDSSLVIGDHTHPGTTVVDTTFSVETLETISASGVIVSTAPAINKIVYRTWIRWASSRWAIAFEAEAVTK